MTRAKLDTQVDSLIEDVATVTGLNPANSQPTKEMRENGIAGGDRDDLHTLISAALKRSRLQILVQAARMHDPDATEETVAAALAAHKTAQV